jgi:hypothetical protein
MVFKLKEKEDKVKKKMTSRELKELEEKIKKEEASDDEEFEEEEEEDDDEEEDETPPSKKTLTVQDVLEDHEGRLANIEAWAFRIKSS